MSKSGVFAHFGSRDELQIAVVREYHTSSRKRSSTRRCASRAACRACARCSRTGCAASRWKSTRAASTSAARSSSTTARPGARCAGPMVQTWQDALERAIRMARRGRPPQARHRPGADAVRGARPDPSRCTTTPASCATRRGRARPPGFAFLRVLENYAVPGVLEEKSPPASRRECARGAFLNPRPGELPCPVHPALRDMQFVMHEVLNVVDELKMLPPCRHRRRHDQRGAGRRRQVRRRGDRPLNRAATPKGLHARQGDARGATPQGLQGGLREVRRRAAGRR